ncbi:MAG: glycosyltransferase [Planctomycetes bacterium]|nr:glycosyltransferase [Planctomycetota bacterium]
MLVLTVSVVVPVNNRAKELAVLLKSLSFQTVLHECIVIDQGSTDGTDQIARNHGALLVSGVGATVGSLRNEGWGASNSSVLAFVDSDHEVPPNWIEKGISVLLSAEQIGIAGAPCLGPDPGTWVSRAWTAHRTRHQGRREVDWLGAGNMFIRKSDFLRVGGFDESLIATEDVDLCHRIRALGLSVVSDPSIVNIHHGEPRTVSEFFKKQLWRGSSGWNAWKKHGYPIAELKSLVFPAWVVLGFIGCVAYLVSGLFRPLQFEPWTALSGFALWSGPMVGMASNVALSKRSIGVIPPLFVLYCAFGVARICSLLTVRSR